MKSNSPKVLFLAAGILFFSFSCGGGSTTPEIRTGSIRVTSTPTGASVLLDGSAKGMTTDCTLSNVPAGDHTVKLVMAGYADYQGPAHVTAGQMAAFNATLTPAAQAGALSISTIGDLVSTGPAGGPFTPLNSAYTLQNSGGASIAWTAGADQGWITVTPTGGNLSAGATAPVTVSINALANALAAGVHNGTVSFNNTTNGAGNTTRGVSLTVTGGNSTIVNVIIDYTRVLPIPNPNGLDSPWVSWAYGTTAGGTRALAKLADDTFSNPIVPLLTETPIRMWVTDVKMDNGTTTRVCRTIRINGQLLDVGTIIYGEVTFILGNDGVVRVQ